ncbi:MAG: hypothetical protein HYZ27_09725, partial [Deltaproteobacteria bacterium]|nr:hypothetical protein [Deltaproteobacteria bacterium]
MRRRGLPFGLYVTMFTSGVVHALVVAAVVFSAQASTGRRVETVLTTKLVRLGKERPKEFLPRTAEPPPPAPKVAPAVKSEAEPATKSASDRLAEMRRLSDALTRVKKGKESEVEGRPDGTPDGEASRLSEALMGNKYGTEIYRCVKGHYDLEGLTPQQVAGRSVGLFVRVKPDGSFFDVRVGRPSGLPAFDRGAQRAVL